MTYHEHRSLVPLPGHNNPPAPWELAPDEPHRIPGHHRAWQFTAKRPAIFRLFVSHYEDGPWWPVKAPDKTDHICIETHSPWTFSMWTVDDPDAGARLTVSWI